jgi:hypothetical protein
MRQAHFQSRSLAVLYLYRGRNVCTPNCSQAILSALPVTPLNNRLSVVRQLVLIPLWTKKPGSWSSHTCSRSSSSSKVASQAFWNSSFNASSTMFDCCHSLYALIAASRGPGMSRRGFSGVCFWAVAVFSTTLGKQDSWAEWARN